MPSVSICSSPSMPERKGSTRLTSARAADICCGLTGRKEATYSSQLQKHRLQNIRDGKLHILSKAAKKDWLR